MRNRSDLPDLVRDYLGRAVSETPRPTRAVRIRQVGQMWMKPGGRDMPFEATEEFSVDRVAFSWHARFRVLGPVAMSVVDGCANGTGSLRVALLGVPIQGATGPETDLGEAMRYLAELAWAPQAIAANRELRWTDIDERTVEVACAVKETKATVRWHFDANGDLERATGLRPFPRGKTFAPTPWGGDFGEYEEFSGTRLPSAGEAWWDLPDGRFVYWRGRIRGLELLPEGAES